MSRSGIANDRYSRPVCAKVAVNGASKPHDPIIGHPSIDDYAEWAAVEENGTIQKRMNE